MIELETYINSGFSRIKSNIEASVKRGSTVYVPLSEVSNQVFLNLVLK